MRIEEDTTGADYAILRLRGEFDTPYVSEFEQKIDELTSRGKSRIILNLRFLLLINSTALGALVRTQKKLRQKGGDLVISHPSEFCRDVIAKLHLDKLIKIFEGDAEALDSVSDGARNSTTVEQASDVLFSYVDSNKAAFAPRPTEIGRIRVWEEDAIVFDWNASNSSLTNDDLSKLLEPGTELRLKFKLPMAKKLDFIELKSKVETSELPKRGTGIRVRARVTEVKDSDRKAMTQFVQDMRYLKNELNKATEG